MRWLRRKDREQDLERELLTHLDAEAAEQRERGLSAEEARYAAHRTFGNLTRTKEEVRHMWGGTGWEIMIQDLRYALRSMRKSPGFGVTAILTLALGIGASTAVFTVVDSVILKPLSYRDSGKLVVGWESVRFLSGEPVGPNPRRVDVWRQRSNAFTDLTFFQHGAVGLTFGGDHPRLIGSVLCLPNLFEVLQVQPMLGRSFIPEDGVKGHENVAILTYALWRDLFHGDSSAIGKTIRIDDVPRQIVGVLPRNFRFPNANALRSMRSRQGTTSALEPSIFAPAALNMMGFTWNGNYGNWITVGRLKPGVRIAQAEAQLNSIEDQITRETPAGQGDHRPGAVLASLQPMQEAIVSDSRTALWLLMAAVMSLMVIACLNLANAQLSRSLARHREAAVRSALGAAKWRILWNVLAENLLLALIGGTVGVLLAFTALNLFRRYSPVDLPRLSEISLNPTVLFFSAFLTVSASLLCGILPALKLIGANPQTSLQQSNSRALGTRHGNRVRTWLIALQVFGCTVLLLITGLFSKSLLHLVRQDKGFETEHLVIAEVRLNINTYGVDQSRILFDDAVLKNLREIPGVQSASLISAMPLRGESWIEPLQRIDKPTQESPLINLRWIAPGFFQASGQKLVAGRFLEEHDRNLHGAVLSERAAQALWGSENPIGGKVRIEGRTFAVVGIVADSLNTSLKMPPTKMAYVHYTDRPPFVTFFLVRAARSADTLISSVRQAIWKYASGVTITGIKTLDSQVEDSLATERFQTFVLMAFGAAALLLAMLGIYGVLSYSVTTRRQEIGVRMALGATRRNVYALTCGEAAIPVIFGLAAGMVASILAARLIRNLLYGIDAVDPAVMLIVTGLFLASATVAAFVPARRAASVDPMGALRAE
jgi:predicted permease